jgi:hypothetical protein
VIACFAGPGRFDPAGASWEGGLRVEQAGRPDYPATMPSPASSPMTLGNVRELGVRSLAVTCELCHHQAVLPADRWGDEVPVPSFRPRMVR